MSMAGGLVLIAILALLLMTNPEMLNNTQSTVSSTVDDITSGEKTPTDVGTDLLEGSKNEVTMPIWLLLLLVVIVVMFFR